MAGPDTEPAADELRNRSNKLRIDKVDTLGSENASVGLEEQAKPPRKTYGRTPDGKGMLTCVLHGPFINSMIPVFSIVSGIHMAELILGCWNYTVFVVPQTHDMVSTLLSPSAPKNASDFAVLGILALHIAALFTLPTSTLRVNVLLSAFLFWRAAYNLGIGILLHSQSNHKALVFWARKSRIFSSEKKHPLYNVIKRELTAKIHDTDYDFDTAPVEFNTWLVFRRLVDLILMCDFVSYSLFAIACMRVPEGESWTMGLGRWLGGLALIAFNLWVKLDAHRVVKDYAWCKCLQHNPDQEWMWLTRGYVQTGGISSFSLTRTSHSMVSLRWLLIQCTLSDMLVTMFVFLPYWDFLCSTLTFCHQGLSLISASYTVLFVSLLAHAAQFAFLTVVENPREPRFPSQVIIKYQLISPS